MQSAVLMLVLAAGDAAGAANPAPPLRGSLGIHDPSTIIKCKDRYYVYGSGQGIVTKSSADRVFWSAGPPIFAGAPAWTTNAVPGFNGYFWAPDIFYLNGRYCVYYAVSTWGSQVSAIGQVTSPTLDPTDPAYRWTDRGPVIRSQVGSPYNTIDPSVMIDAAGQAWMAFGSYWNGIYVVQLDPLSGLRLAPDSPTYRVAYNSSIEAACLFRRGAQYYLFVNWGSCCDGVNSTYNLRVGRSASPTGPFRDRNGVDLAANGGTLFLESTGKFAGPGHAGILVEDGPEWLSYHYYDANAYAPWYNAYGVANFDIEPLTWTADGWPSFTNDWAAVYRFQADARDEGGQYDGLLRGSPALTEDPVRGRVLQLDGTNQYVQLPPGVAYARTFVAVVNWSGGAAWQRLFDFGTDTTRYVMLTPASGNGRLRCDIRANGVTQTVEAPNRLTPGVWSQVALTFDGQRAVLYANGSPVAANPNLNLSPPEVRAQTNHLGRSKFAVDPDFSGRISSFRAYGRALSAAEIAAPQVVISQPPPGATYRPGERLVFAGSARDLVDTPIAAAGLTWTIYWMDGGSAKSVLGPLGGTTNGAFVIPLTGVEATNGFYRIRLVATDSAARAATNAVEVFPVSGAGGNRGWASFYPFTAGPLDASNRFHGSLLGGASIVADAARGPVLQLSGANQHVSLPAGVATLQTFSAWVKWNGGGAWQRVFDFGRDTSRWLYLCPRTSDGRLQCALTSDSASFVQVIEAPDPLPSGVWTHVAVTFDGRQGVLAVNGQPVAINNSVNLLPSDVGATRCFLGRSQFAADPYFAGRIDSVRLHSRPLTLAEVVAPMPIITAPGPDTRFAGGDVIPFAGTAVDYADAGLPSAALTWTAALVHDDRGQPVLGPLSGVAGGTLPIPTTGPASTNLYYRLSLQATDAAGRQGRSTIDVWPRVASLSLDTVPSGLQVTLDGEPLATPVTLPLCVGMTRLLGAPSPQTFGGVPFDFVAWSDGGAAEHALRMPDLSTNLTASFVWPELAAERTAVGCRLRWPQWAVAGFTLRSAGDLRPPITWSPVPEEPQFAGGRAFLSLPATGTARYFQLLPR